MKITFINPGIGAYPVNFKLCMDLAGAKSSHIPLALATLAALSPADYDLRIFDENIEPLPERVSSGVVAITGTIMQKKRIFEIAKQYKSPGTTVVIGGPVTFYAEEECGQSADVVFVGEAEDTWPRFLAELGRGEHSKIYRQEGFVDFAKSPVPRLDLLKCDRYSAACVQVTRGCSYKCLYCDVPVKYGDVPRVKELDQVLREVENADRAGFDSVFFVDDNFTADRQSASRLLDALSAQRKTLKNRMSYYTQVTLNVGKDEAILAKFRKAGFERLFIGIETFNADLLRALNKAHNMEMDIREAVARIHSHGITVWAGIMLGMGNGDYEQLDALLDFIQTTGIMPIQVGVMQAVPGTPLYEQLTRKGALAALPSVFGSAVINDANIPSLTNILHPSISESDARNLTSGFYEKLFLPEMFAQRIINSSKNSAENRVQTPQLTWRNIKILLRATTYYLFRAPAPHRKMFLRLLGAVLKRQVVRLDELAFSLVIFKHFHEYYTATAHRMRQ
ncbi:MAG: B12-binding domain-containing radical SAM protein [Nitrospinae bacterium]|nr:B12-binding domain-containing radical SAM protein [Nitrospinota bacterium]